MEVFQRLVIIVILLALLFPLMFFKPFITGFISRVMNVSVEVNESARAGAYVFINPNRTLERSYENIGISVFCENIGSIPYSGYTKVEVFDPNNRMIFSVTSNEYNIRPSEVNKYNLFWNTDNYPAGFYTIKGICFYPNGSASDTEELEIYRIPVAAVTEGPIGAPAPPPTPDMTLEYPSFLNLTQAVDYPVLITIKNTGNTDLHNIILELKSEELKTRIDYPAVIGLLKPGGSRLAVGLIRVSPEQKPGNYTVEILARSDEKNVTGVIEVKVVVLEIKEKAKELLDHYDSLIEQVEDEIGRVEKEEKRNVTKARSTLDEARQEWFAAKKLFELRQYQDSIEQLDVVKEKIKESIIELAKAPPIEGPEEVRVPAWLTNFVLYLIGGIILLVWLLVMVKRRRERSRFRRFSRW